MPDLEGPRWQDLAHGFLLLTRLPVPPPPGEPRGAAGAWAWPAVGAVVGLCGATVAALALWSGLSPGIAGALALGAQALATGALHEDGLADSADGLWGGATPARRLEIMSDSRIGSYGALALVLTTLARWSAVSVLLAQGQVWAPLVAAGALSRWPLAAILWALPPARDGGLSRLVGRPRGLTVAMAGALALLLSLLVAGPPALGAALATLAATLAWIAVARAKLGGQTGDVCGAGQQLAELAALAALDALLT